MCSILLASDRYIILLSAIITYNLNITINELSITINKLSITINELSIKILYLFVTSLNTSKYNYII